MTLCLFDADDVAEAYNLIKDLEPTTPQEYILKGVVNAALGQEQASVSHSLSLGGASCEASVSHSLSLGGASCEASMSHSLSVGGDSGKRQRMFFNSTDFLLFLLII